MISMICGQTEVCVAMEHLQRAHSDGSLIRFASQLGHPAIAIDFAVVRTRDAVGKAHDALMGTNRQSVHLNADQARLMYDVAKGSESDLGTAAERYPDSELGAICNKLGMIQSILRDFF